MVDNGHHDVDWRAVLVLLKVVAVFSFIVGLVLALILVEVWILEQLLLPDR